MIFFENMVEHVDGSTMFLDFLSFLLFVFLFVYLPFHNFLRHFYLFPFSFPFSTPFPYLSLLSSSPLFLSSL